MNYTTATTFKDWTDKKYFFLKNAQINLTDPYCLNVYCTILE